MMTTGQLIRRSLRYYWRTHLGVLLGAALACAILTGALAVGDSVRATLRAFGLARLGATQQALATGDRFFRAQLADDIAAALGGDVAPVLLLRGAAMLPDGSARANEVQIAGVDERFWRIGGTTNPLPHAETAEAVVNERLATQLSLREGDTMIVRVEPPSLVSRDAPMSGRSDETVAIRLRVRSIADDRAFGRFGLQANQIPPLTIFLPLAALQQNVKQVGRANVLLVASPGDAGAALARTWTLADAGLSFRVAAGMTELRSASVFIDPAVATAALAISSNASGVLTYFANEITHGERSTPYSFVAAKSWEHAALDIAGNEMVINRWLADDLAARPGDELTMRYFVIGERRELRETATTFRVAAVIPTVNDPSWMPDFPGLADADNCRDWEPGIPVDMDRIRPKDEDYWDTYRGTPKAFVTLATGQALWSNRFGSLTAIRFPPEAGLEARLRAALDPASLGLFFVPLRERALSAGDQAMDFGQLFIGFSFFLIVAALLLTAMLFVFHLEQRRVEAGLLRALGFAPRRVGRLLLIEGIAVAVLATLPGAAAGAVFTRLTLLGLATVWRGAVGAAAFQQQVEPASLAIGMIASVCAAAVAMGLAQRGLFQRAPVELLAGGGAGPTPRRNRRGGLWTGLAGAAGALALLACSRGAKGETAAGLFFGAGALLLAAGIGLCQHRFAAMGRVAGGLPSLAAVGRRNASRRPGRSLTTVAVLAGGIFMVVAVGAFQQDPRRDATSRASGTGGFALFARSAAPVYDDLNTAEGRRLYNLADDAMRGVAVVPLRVRDGEEASCLNLNRAQQPMILGVRPGELAARGAFTFTGAGESWSLLTETGDDDTIPAIGDQQTVTWALGRKTGDVVALTDDHGRAFRLRIVGTVARTILQGGLLIDERRFVERFPASGGYRAFLVDAPPERAADVAVALSLGLQDRGLEMTPAWRRLAAFMEVENTYLGIFQALGALGLLLGSAGLGIVVLRNVAERRGELALLQAVGFRKAALHRLVLAEHILLIALGLLVGTTAAAAAIVPPLLASADGIPLRGILLTLAGLAGGGFLWCRLAVGAALRGSLIAALRTE